MLLVMCMFSHKGSSQQQEGFCWSQQPLISWPNNRQATVVRNKYLVITLQMLCNNDRADSSID